jgi:hypothetical protein
MSVGPILFLCGWREVTRVRKTTVHTQKVKALVVKGVLVSVLVPGTHR